jgi:hypothetical protein
MGRGFGQSGDQLEIGRVTDGPRWSENSENKKELDLVSTFFCYWLTRISSSTDGSVGT